MTRSTRGPIIGKVSHKKCRKQQAFGTFCVTVMIYCRARIAATLNSDEL